MFAQPKNFSDFGVGFPPKQVGAVGTALAWVSSPLRTSAGKIAGCVPHGTARSQFRGGSEADLFTHSTRLVAFPPATGRGNFRRQCGGVFKRGQCSTTFAGALAILLLMAPNSFAWPVTIQRPLVTVATAAETLNKSPGEIARLIEAGELLFAFNLASRNATKAEVRILAQSLADYQNDNCHVRADELPRALRLIFPNIIPRAGVVATITASSLADHLSVSADHVFNLVKEGSLHLMRGTKCRRGPGGSPEVEFASVVEFLRRRRIL